MSINIYGWIFIVIVLVRSGVYIGNMPDKKMAKVIGALVGALIEFLVLLKALRVF